MVSRSQRRAPLDRPRGAKVWRRSCKRKSSTFADSTADSKAVRI
jgi:hypothetical protein